MLVINLDPKAKEFVESCCALASKMLTLASADGKVCDSHFAIGMRDLLEIQQLMLIEGPIALRNELILMVTSAVDDMLYHTNKAVNSRLISYDEGMMVVGLADRVIRAYETAEEI